MRSKIIAGNWKMNPVAADFEQLTRTISEGVQKLTPDSQVMLFPPALYLSKMLKLTNNNTHLAIGAQNCHYEPKGAFTGELSPQMLSGIGAKHVILGHSERRKYFGESNQFLRAKVDSALEAGLTVIYCCGESLDEREAQQQEAVVEEQVDKALLHLTPEQFEQIVIAYEPVWAIGTGRTALPEQAQEMHRFIRELLAKRLDQSTADACRILYGGSMKPANAADLLAQPDVDGGLIGGASLKAADFCEIVKAAG